MKLSEKQQLGLMIVVFVLLLGGEGVWGYFCLEERSELQAELEQLDRQEKTAQALVATIPALRKKAQEMAAIIEEYVTILPSEEEARYEAFLVDIDNFARESGLELLSGSGEQVRDRRPSRRNAKKINEKRNNFVRHRYRFELRGEFLNFLKFMSRVENHRRFLRIDDINIRPIDSEEQDRGLEEIILAENPQKEIEVVISTYTYSKPASAAEAGGEKK